jgi:hypothetical protein
MRFVASLQQQNGSIRMACKSALRVSSTGLILFMLAGAAPSSAPAAPVCGEATLELEGGATAGLWWLSHDGAEIEAIFPLRPENIKGRRFSLDKAELRVKFHWPYTDFAPEPSFYLGTLTDHGRPAEGVLQFECGDRNMGLVNFEISFGLPRRDSQPEEESECVRELERDGAFRVTIDQDSDVHMLMTGRIDFKTAKSLVGRYVEAELQRAREGSCTFRAPPVIF